MKGDFTRSTFNPRKQYSGVRMQQGRVQLDADWNEQVDIDMYRDRVTTGDIIGVSGVAGIKGSDGKYAFDGFKIMSNGANSDFQIGAGRIYVNGILCDNNSDSGDVGFYLSQPYLKPLPAGTTTFSPTVGRYLVYLDVWQRHLTALDDPEIQEVALGGPDTTTRTQNVWHAKLVQLTSGTYTSCSANMPEFDGLIRANDSRLGKMAAAVDSAPLGTSDPCILPANAGYRGLENQLYRVEIHDATPGAVKFKWSRDNGSVAVAVEAFGVGGATKVQVKSLGRDEVYRLKTGDTVEVITQRQEKNGQPGVLCQITGVDEAQRILTLSASFSGAEYDSTAIAKVRRWEGGPVTITFGTNYVLENGISVTFSSGLFQVGDYWQIPARTETASIEWPLYGGSPSVPRHGTGHYYAKLAIIDYNGTQWSVIDDCRNFAFPITDFPNEFYYVSGDGQEAMPNQLLPRPLQVGVANRLRAVAGVRIKYTITAGSGTLAADSGFSWEPVSSTSIIVLTNTAGIASCTYKLDGTNNSQQVKAVIVDSAGVESHLPPVKFNANPSVAALVAYTPPVECTKLAGITNVKDALDELCECDCNDCDPVLYVLEFTFWDGTPFIYNAVMPITLLQQGFRMQFSQPIDPMTVNTMAFGFYMFMPFMHACPGCTDIWYGTGSPNPDHLFYQPLLIHPEFVQVDASDPTGATIRWKPWDPMFDRIRTVINTLPPHIKILARFLAKGNFIWAAGDQKMLLGGKVFPVGATFQPPMADECIEEGNFDFYWWFSPVVAPGPTVTVTNVTANVPTDGQPCRTPFTITVRLNGGVSGPTSVHLDIDGAPSVFAPDMDVTFNTSDGNPAVKTINIPLLSPTVSVAADTLVTVRATLNGGWAETQFWLRRCPTIIKCETDMPNNIVVPGQAYKYRVELERNAPFDTVVQVTTSDANLVPAFNVTIPAGQRIKTHDLVAPVVYGGGTTNVQFTSTVLTYTVGPCVFTLQIQQQSLPVLQTFEVYQPSSKKIPCGGTANARLTLVSPVPAGNSVTVNLTSVTPYTNIPSTVVFNAGEVMKTFNIVAQNCANLFVDTTAFVRASTGSVVKEDFVIVQASQTTPVLQVTNIEVLHDEEVLTTYNEQEPPFDPNLFVSPIANRVRFTFNAPPEPGSVRLQTQEMEGSISVSLTGGPSGPTFNLEYNPGDMTFALFIPGQIPPGVYRFILYGSPTHMSLMLAGTLLDGTLGDHPLPSGDGAAGGNCEFYLHVG